MVEQGRGVVHVVIAQAERLDYLLVAGQQECIGSTELGVVGTISLAILFWEQAFGKCFAYNAGPALPLIVDASEHLVFLGGKPEVHRDREIFVDLSAFAGWPGLF